MRYILGLILFLDQFLQRNLELFVWYVYKVNNLSNCKILDLAQECFHGLRTHISHKILIQKVL
jgi:hypothetical protein